MPDLSCDSLKNNLSNPARPYLWEILIAQPVVGSTQTYALRAQSTSQPERSIGAITIPYKASAGFVVPGKLSYPHDWDVTFVEGEDRYVLRNFYTWLNTIIDDRTNSGSAVSKIDIHLNMLNTDGSYALQTRLIGCWPRRMSDVALDYTNEDVMRFTVTFAYDRWEITDLANAGGIVSQVSIGINGAQNILNSVQNILNILH